MTITAHLYHPDFLPACETGDLETVTKILNHETPQISTAQLQKGLSNAVWRDHLAVADLLLSEGARVNRMAFVGASNRGDPAMYEVFIKNGWDVNTTEFPEGTALRYLLTLSLSLPKLANHANLLREPDYPSVTPPPLMSLLLSHSADPNLLSIPARIRSRSAPSALITAAVEEGQGGADAIRTLLDHGAVLDPNIIHHAIEASCCWRNIDEEHGCAERVRLLIDAAKETKEGVQWYLNYLDPKKKGTPLHCAIWAERLETVQVLVGEGADVGVLFRGMTVAQAARRRAEMVGGDEEATRIWEWLTGRRWEDGEGIEDVDGEGSTFKDEVEVEGGTMVELKSGETEYRSGNIGKALRLCAGFGALTIDLELSGHLA